ncbi:MAG TPA: type II toxin-antitoxin system Phd/YefM family antitoxin [Candidatus Limnocylindria bacterium]|nr:type II toxin-antitoxin system Phd/YefM family antitoxin [Candidatus Limnocylindria bacterium]
MKTVPITEFRQRAAEIISDVRAGEPAVVLQRSQKVAYLVGPDDYERDQAELAALRRGLFLVEVREAEAEYRTGEATSFEGVESLLDALEH